MKKTVFMFLLLCYMTKAEINKYSAKCNNSSRSGLTFEPTSDGVQGRYRVEWCTTADRNVTNWKLTMRYDDTRTASHCKKYNISSPPGQLHSRFDESVDLDLNCTNICFSINLDLIFNGTCYHIKTWLHRGTRSSSPHDSVHYILNPYPKEHFTDSIAVVHTLSTNEQFVVHWYLGYVPATDYTMDLCTHDFQRCVNINGNCSTTGACQCEVRCVLSAPFGQYYVQLHQQAPWTAAEALFRPLVNVNHEAWHREPAVLPAAASRAALWWLCAAAAVAALAALLLLRAHSARLAAAMRLRVLRDWLDRPEAEPVMKPANHNEAEEPDRILLLYARDCAQFTRVAGLLRALLAEGTGCQVLDLYSASAVRDSARAPAEWLQRALDAPRARVVLLQSPAAAALHAPAHSPQRALPAAPHAGDWLLALALRRLAEGGHVGLPYRKYFVAQIAGLEVEVLPHLTRLRRYALPAAAELLLRDLAPGRPQPGPHAARLRQLADAVDELSRYVRDHPDYLAELFHVC